MCMEWDIELVQCVWSGTLGRYSVCVMELWAHAILLQPCSAIPHHGGGQGQGNHGNDKDAQQQLLELMVML